MSVATFCAPRWMHVPDHVDTYGPEVADLAADVGLTLDPEQRLVTDAMYAVDAEDRLVATEVGASGPRQNFKTHVAKAAALADLVLFREPECVWTAHLRDTAYKAFRDPEGTGLADLFDNFDFLRRLVEDITDSDGQRSITLKPKSAGMPRPTIEFSTRSDRGGRGYTGRRVTFDEALYLKASMTAAMVPILSARSMTGRVQVRYLGSPGVKSSDVWREVRDRGRPGTARALAWIEWAAEQVACEAMDCPHTLGTEGCALDREDLVRQANLAIDRRIDIRFVMETERTALTPEDYMRERLGWWDEPVDGGGVLDLNVWGGLAVGNQEQVFPTLGVEVALDRSSALIGAAWEVDGKPHLELVQPKKAGTDWIPDRVTELWQRYACPLVVLDAGTEAASLAPALEERGVELLMVTGAKRAAACGAFWDAAMGRKLTHNGDPLIAEAIGNARWKDVGDGARVFSRRKSAGDISALYAVTLALAGHEEARCAVPNIY